MINIFLCLNYLYVAIDNLSTPAVEGLLIVIVIQM